MGFLFIFFSDHNDHVSPSPSSSPSPATTLFRTRSSRLLLSKAQSTISICIFLLLLILFLFTPSTSEPSSGFSAVSPRRFLLNCNVTVTRRRSNRFALQPSERGQSGTGVGCLLPEIALSYEAIFITLNLDLNCACVYPKFMATTRFNVSCCFPASIRLGLKARTERISYPQALATPRHHLVRIRNKDRTLVVNAEMAGGEAPKRSYPEKSKGFIEEMKYVAMRMHPKDQAKEGKREYKDPQDGPIATWKFTLEGYLMFLVENKLVFDTLERIIHDSTVPTYVAFKNTGLERAETLGRDLEWFKEQGYEIPEPMANCKTYSQYLKAIAENDPPAFICHFYNIYFAHSAGGRKIGTLVSKRILDNKELEFYKWDGHVSELLKNVSEELNKVSELWTREEKNHCLEETEKAFKLYGEIFRSLVS